jgi:hypothetical protein
LENNAYYQGEEVVFLLMKYIINRGESNDEGENDEKSRVVLPTSHTVGWWVSWQA